MGYGDSESSEWESSLVRSDLGLMRDRLKNDDNHGDFSNWIGMYAPTLVNVILKQLDVYRQVIHNNYKSLKVIILL